MKSKEQKFVTLGDMVKCVLLLIGISIIIYIFTGVGPFKALVYVYGVGGTIIVIASLIRYLMDELIGKSRERKAVRLKEEAKRIERELARINELARRVKRESTQK